MPCPRNRESRKVPQLHILPPDVRAKEKGCVYISRPFLVDDNRLLVSEKRKEIRKKSEKARNTAMNS